MRTVQRWVRLAIDWAARRLRTWPMPRGPIRFWGGIEGSWPVSLMVQKRVDTQVGLELTMQLSNSLSAWPKTILTGDTIGLLAPWPISGTRCQTRRLATC